MMSLRISFACILALTAGCGDDNGTQTNNNSNQTTNNNTPFCGNLQLDPGEECDLGTDNSDAPNATCRQDCQPRSCGDGVVDDLHNEDCDEGAGNSDAPNAACRLDCRLPHCGDNILDDQANESCDEGINNSDAPNATCRVGCQLPRCGDGVIDDLSGEECDDATANSDVDPDACRTNCLSAGCGDAVVDSGEDCDDATANSDVDPDACRSDCQEAGCGDAVVDTGEACDATNLGGTTCASRGFDTGTLACDGGCSYDESLCIDFVCGDGQITWQEYCDGANLGGVTCESLGYSGGSLTCSPTCTFDVGNCQGTPLLPVGAPCHQNSDCGGGTCLAELTEQHWGLPGGYCVEPCGVGGTCGGSGANGVCVSSFNFCLASCDPTAPNCRDGYACVNTGGADYVCMWGYCDNNAHCPVTGTCEQDPADPHFGFCVSIPEACTSGADEDFDNLVDCADPDCNGDPACPSGEVCGNALDDDGDGLADCADGECASLGSCMGALCTPATGAQLSCGSVLTGESNDQAGSTDLLVGARCVAPDSAQSPLLLQNETGPEYAYTLTVSSPQVVTITVSGFGQDLDVYVLKQYLGDCDPYSGCFASGVNITGVDEVVSFSAYPGLTYYVVVEGYNHSVDSYDLSVACATGGYEDCADGLDNDGDTLVDCDDPECWGVASCTTETTCDNGLDENFDGAIDCADPSCSSAPGC